MNWIELENRLPTDTDIPNWQAWLPARWQAWLNKSAQLVVEMAALDANGQREERNQLIDANSAHWGELKPWLLALSAGKCWFSDVRDLNAHYEVEHFRPKKEAKALDGTLRDGYWWLAFDYMNFRVCGNVANRKKGGWFPLKAGSLRSTFAEPCEESEAPYLLDPVDDHDVNLITFDEEGKVIPKPNASDWEKARVIETVKRLKLNEHAPLAEERRKICQKVNGLIDDFQLYSKRCSNGNNPAVKAKLTCIRKKMRELTDRKAELAVVARWCIEVRADPQLSRLLA